MTKIALTKIDRLIGTFDFVSPDNKAVARSLILTVVARPGMPQRHCMASTRRSWATANRSWSTSRAARILRLNDQRIQA
jgi:hypothetical protein